MTVTSDEVKLITISDLEKSLSKTEPLATHEFVADGSDKVEFVLNAGWATDFKNKLGTDSVDAVVRVNGAELPLTKDALLQATSQIGMTQQYVTKSPKDLIVPGLNYWMNNTPKAALKFLTAKGTAVALTKASVSPVSNLKLLETTLDGIKELYGKSTEVKVDYKMHHDLRKTQFRLIIPEKSRKIVSARANETDNWSIGIDFQNSLTAESGLRERGYMFAWWCTNGSISTHASSGTWSRKGSPSEDQALEWAKAAVDGVLGGLEHELDNIEALTKIKIEGEVNARLQDIFEKYRVPAQAREGIIAELIESDDLTMYGVMQAITQAANNQAFTPAVVTRLMEIGGDLPSSAPDACDSCHRLPIS